MIDIDIYDMIYDVCFCDQFSSVIFCVLVVIYNWLLSFWLTEY